MNEKTKIGAAATSFRNWTGKSQIESVSQIEYPFLG